MKCVKKSISHLNKKDKFFETIKIINGYAPNLKYHNFRLNKTIQEIYDIDSKIDLKDYIQKRPNRGIFRCKIIYDTDIKSVEFTPYKKRVFKSFKLVNSDITYSYKSLNRDKIDNLYKQKGIYDDIIIIKNGLITDTSIANILIYDGIKWFTPKQPLLSGTTRAKLLENKIITEKDFKIKDFKNMVSFAIINALVGFYEIKDAKFGDLNDTKLSF